MEETTAVIPPRNGEGDHAQHGGGVETRVRHRTVGADGQNVRFARNLRRAMTLPEVLLWQQLRRRPSGFRFRRQFPIAGYVLDFACLDRRLAIEVDGEVHNRSDRPDRDQRRDETLDALGFMTLRIPARNVLKELDSVLSLIVLQCEGRPLHHSAAPSGPPPRSGEDWR